MKVRRHRKLRKTIAWGSFVVITSLAGGLWFAFLYMTDSDTIVRLIKSELPRYLPGSQIEVSRAKVRPFTGEIHLTNIVARQNVDGKRFSTISIPWLGLRHDPKALLEGRFEPSEVVVTHPTLRLRRRQDGTWNLQGLLADPWPGPIMKTPPIQVVNGTVELFDSEDPGAAGAPILRDVAVRVESAGKGILKFEGTAKGDMFDRLSLVGTVNIDTGRVEFGGDVARLAITEKLHGRLPAELRPACDEFGLSSGEVDLKLGRISYDASTVPHISYDLSGYLRNGTWTCPRLPFPINDLSAEFELHDSALRLEHAEGYYGTTSLRLESSNIALADLERGPFDCKIEILDLKLDAKLKEKTPPHLAKLWNEFQPSGRMNVFVTAAREKSGGPIEKKMTIECIDVAMLYEHFRYPVEHIRGRLIFEGDQIALKDMETLIEGQKLVAQGLIEHPGPRATVRIDFEGQGLPINKKLFDALPTDVREVVDDFQPTGTVGGKLTVRRWPPVQSNDDPRGVVKIDAVLDLNERCAMTWKGLPYPVNNLTGRLTIHPDLWEFENMRGSNGQAKIAGSGRVQKVGPGKNDLNVDLRLIAEKLPLDDQLHDALPPAWRKTWAVLDPIGSCDVDAAIKVGPGRPDSYVLKITPRHSTSVRLRYTREPKPGIDPGGNFELPMDHVSGLFVFNNGPVDMHDVGFRFHDAPVKFTQGRVIVEDTGKFELGVAGLEAKDIHLDQRLRQIMPPVMAQFAQRLDDGRTFTLKGNMALGWLGKKEDPVWCRWNNARVVFIDNSVQIQPGLALEHIQGEVDHVHGWSDGATFDVHGAMRLESFSILGQQITGLESPIDVERGVARLDSLQGTLLDGQLNGKVSVSLASTPQYAASIFVKNADLQQYAKTLPGRQTFRGLVSGQFNLKGFGSDLHTLQGGGEAHVVNGDLGELPAFLRLVKILNLSPATKTAFDSADVFVTIDNGKSYFDPIRFTGNAFSLHGKGTMDVQGDLDMRLRVLYGRDRMHLRLVSDAVREASGQFLVVRILGTPSFPKPKLEALPEAADALKSITKGRKAASLR